MIAVILPTRGLVFAEVENSIELIRQFIPQTIVLRTWNRTLPEAQNELVEMALGIEDLTHLLFVEEDTVMPHPQEGILKMLESKADIACIDYGVAGYSCVAHDDKTNEILWCGFGCTLVKKEVFDKVEKPWFRTDKSLRLNDWTWIDNPAKYGGQDIWFCTKAREAGFTITQIEGECKHLRLDGLGTPETNKGLHAISEKQKIQTVQMIDVPKGMEVN